MLVSMTMKVQPEFKEEFTYIAESLGMPAGTAMRVLAQKFIDEKGFPFDVCMPRFEFNTNDKRIIKTYVKEGKLIMPDAWRDDDDEEDE